MAVISWGPTTVTLDMFFIGCRVCVRGKGGTCGRVVRLMPMTGRVVVRLDPPHPSWRGALRSFRPEHLAILPLAADAAVSIEPGARASARRQINHTSNLRASSDVLGVAPIARKPWPT
jgi:hypothetical protein